MKSILWLKQCIFLCRADIMYLGDLKTRGFFCLRNEENANLAILVVSCSKIIHFELLPPLL